MYNFTSLAATAHIVGQQYEKAIELCRWSLRLNRMYAASHRLLVISMVLAGQEQEARKAVPELLSLEPRLSVERWRARYPGNRSPHIDRLCDALAAAGIPRV
jgi:hypothetical protein